MSFATFSGSSKRLRNVNMSGQKNLNPFAASSWTPAASSGASKTVADAQAERRQRQLERDKLKAAESIQRVWRAHRVRRTVKDDRRATLDRLYHDPSFSDPAARSSEALKLVVAVLDPARSDDRIRLERFVVDLGTSDYAVLASARKGQVKKLVQQLLVLLKSSNHAELPRPILEAIISIYQRRFELAPDSLDTLYSVVGKYCQNGNITDKQTLALLEQAILVPIQRDSGNSAPRAFTLNFLTVPNLGLFEGNVRGFTTHIDLEKVSGAIVEAYNVGWPSSQSADSRLWLLAHFIALGNSSTDLSFGSSYLNAMYIQLSSLQGELKRHHIGQDATPSASEADSQKRLPPYIEHAIQSLVQRDEISHIVQKFTTNFVGSSQQEHHEASLLAAYLLTLIRCFPTLSDDIRMKLYLADIPSQSGHPNSVVFFWEAMIHTKVFALIQSDDQGSTLDLLRRKTTKQLSALQDDTLWDREWRAIFLFLELYVFVLRLADDEDFSYPWASAGFHTEAPSRIRQCMLPLDDLKGLTVFLKNLAFTLYYSSNELRHHASLLSKHSLPDPSVDELFSPTLSAPEKKKKANESYNVISGVDFDTFRNAITTAMRMIYERDSRRQFLPRDHWLMTSRFDMSTFMDAVVVEVERQRELKDESTDSEDEDAELDNEEDSQDAYGRIPLGYAGIASQALRIQRMKVFHKKEQRKRVLAAVGPKLEILRNMPFIIPFDVRVKIFRKLVTIDKFRRRHGAVEADQWRLRVVAELRERGARERLRRHHAKVRRGKVFEDAFEQFYELHEGLKEPIQITFVDQFDIPEAGIDGGGVTKEFLTSVTKEAFTDELSLFVPNDANALFPNPMALDQRQEKLRESGLAPDSEDWRETITNLLAQYEFLGRIIGKCLYEGILIDVVFAGFFLLKWAAAASDAGYRANINDLREYDQELYNGMMRLKNYPGDVSELGLDFTIEDQVSMPGEPTRIITRNLIPNGDNTPVTNENKLLYINYVARHRLVAQPFAVTRAFLTGLGMIIEPTWLSMFNQSELQRLVGGDSSEIDIEDLRANTIYAGVYQIGDDGEEHPTIKLFWQVLRGMEDSQRRDVLKYVTSTPRAPLLGFSQLSPRFSIRDGGSDTTRLPSASTCVNLLKLPMYETAALLKEKLLYAVSSGAGFDLS